VIVCGGFGGLRAARALRHAPVAVTLIDRMNHHVFQPLLLHETPGPPVAYCAAMHDPGLRGDLSSREKPRPCLTYRHQVPVHEDEEGLVSLHH
jgi:hypothetical protein